jgi:hypothetical protein
MSSRTLLSAAMLSGLACGEKAAPATTTAAQPTAPADSLVATAPGGTEIWFTLARVDSGGGRRCVARTIEIRRGSTRTPVPLLYTGAAPEIVNDSTARARLYNGCAPGDVYLVDLRTGRPTRERR